MRKIITLLGVFSAILIISGCASTNSDNFSGRKIFYYGITCPHCQKVEKFMSEQRVTEKFQFEQKEVYNNKDNASEMARVAKVCGLDQQNLGVPLFWTGQECLIGDAPIIEYLKNQIK
jgi:glutaredoxin